jgi:hypothetical protein
VSKFVITIAPDADGGFAGANTTVRVDTSSGQARITELTVRASDGAGLVPSDLPVVDLELLIRALAGAPAGTRAPAPAAPAGGRAGTRTVRGGVPKPPAGKKATAGGSTGPGGAGPDTPPPAPTGAGREGRRAYRRMPEPATVLAAYQKTGTVTGMAKYFGVPRHTATGWARRLRAEGHAIGRG